MHLMKTDYFLFMCANSLHMSHRETFYPQDGIHTFSLSAKIMKTSISSHMEQVLEKFHRQGQFMSVHSFLFLPFLGKIFDPLWSFSGRFRPLI